MRAIPFQTHSLTGHLRTQYATATTDSSSSAILTMTFFSAKTAAVLCFLVGISNAFPNQINIIGGSDAHEGEFPHLVQIQVTAANVTLCGGAIVSELGKQFVVTSAHCASGLQNDYDEVRVVAGDVDKTMASGREQIRVANKYVVHPAFNAETHANDIAIIGIDAPFNDTGDVRPIRLPLQGQNTTGFVLIAGFGGDQETEAGRAEQNVLQKLQMPLLSDEECALYYANSTFQPRATNVCALSRSGTNAHCFGDRGGPAMSVNFRHLSGVISYPTSCTDATPGMPDVYTEVSHYVNWIKLVALLM